MERHVFKNDFVPFTFSFTSQSTVMVVLGRWLLKGRKAINQTKKNFFSH